MKKRKSPALDPLFGAAIVAIECFPDHTSEILSQAGYVSATGVKLEDGLKKKP